MAIGGHFRHFLLSLFIKQGWGEGEKGRERGKVTKIVEEERSLRSRNDRTRGGGGGGARDSDEDAGGGR